MLSFLKRRPIGDIKSDKSGSTLVEFAIILLPLMYILIGIVNFGYAFYAYNSIQNASIEAARAFSHGELNRAQAISFVNQKAREYNPSLGVAWMTNPSSQSAQMNVLITTDAFELIDFPYASLNYYTPYVILSHETPTYNTSPYS